MCKIQIINLNDFYVYYDTYFLYQNNKNNVEFFNFLMLGGFNFICENQNIIKKLKSRFIS